MKTKRLHTVITIILAIVFAASLQATNSQPVPININPPTAELTNESLNSVFDFEEEAYIDDIPFDTECVSKNCLYQKALSVVYTFNEEQYINDIPFDTEVVKTQNENKANAQLDFTFEDEDYIDDIPFDTYTLAFKNNRNHMAFHK